MSDNDRDTIRPTGEDPVERNDTDPPDDEPTSLVDMGEIIRQHDESTLSGLHGLLAVYNRRSLHALRAGL